MPAELAAKLREAHGVAEGERKQVTILFADVQGSMGLSGSVSAEDWWSIMGRLFAVLCDGVHRFEGRVDRFTGDGIMAVFGAPLALEDHAQRACHAALWLRDEVRSYADELRRERELSLAVRLGLNSGEVVVGTIGDDLSVEYTAIGHTAGLAQRMETIAAPGTVFLTESTAALVRGFFVVEPREGVPVKGVGDAVTVYELTGRGDVETMFARSRASGLSEYVGRQSELAELNEALARASAGDGQVIGVGGEPGVGKSRLCHEFVARCAESGIAAWQAHALAHATGVPFMPVLALLREYFEIDVGAPPENARARVLVRLGELDLDLGDALALLLEFLNIDPTPAGRVDPEARQRHLFAIVNEIVAARAQQRPGVIVVEDLQWIDPGSAALLRSLAASIRGGQTLLLVTYRSGYEPDRLGLTTDRELRLEPLGRHASTTLLRGLIGSDGSLDGLAELIHDRSEGNPFFIEEIVKTLADNGTLTGRPGGYRLRRSIDDVEIPDTVESVLASRIDRLPPQARDVLQVAAVIGRRFDEAALRLVVDGGDRRLTDAIEELLQAELIRRVGEQGEYLIAHALAEQVAYRTQLTRRRERIHAAVARALEELNPDRLDELAALIGHHRVQAADRLGAAHWYARAAAWAGFSDPNEALRQWRRVRELNDSAAAPDPDVALGARVMLLNLRWRQGVPAGSTAEEYQHESAELYDEVRTLARASGNAMAEAIALAAFGTVQGHGGNLEAMASLGMAAVRVAEGAGDLGLRMAILPAAMYSRFALGRYAEVISLGEQAAGLIPEDPSAGSGITFTEPYASVLTWESAARTHAGDLPGGVAGYERALERARAAGDLEVETWVHMSLVQATQLAGGGRDPLRHAHAAMALAERIGGAYSLGLAWRYMAIAELLHENWQRSIEAAERALSIWRPRRIGLEAEPHALTACARAQLAMGDAEASLMTARLAAELGMERGTRGHELEARIALAQALRAVAGGDAVSDLAGELGRASQLAAASGARTLEPRVHVELAELARLCGDHARCERELSVAERMFREVGAPILADRVARALSWS